MYDTQNLHQLQQHIDELEKALASTREVLARLLYALATDAANEAQLKSLIEGLGFDWGVLVRRTKNTTGNLGKKGIIRKGE